MSRGWSGIISKNYVSGDIVVCALVIEQVCNVLRHCPLQHCGVEPEQTRVSQIVPVPLYATNVRATDVVQRGVVAPLHARAVIVCVELLVSVVVLILAEYGATVSALPMAVPSR